MNLPLIIIMRNIISIIFLALVVVLISCKKEEQKSKTELLCGKYWKMTALTSDSEIPVKDDDGNITGYTHNFFSGMAACATDDVFIYDTDGTYSWDAKTLCSSNDLQNGTGTWIFNDDETVIRQVQDNNGFIMEFTDIHLSDNKFTGRFDFVLPDETYKLTATFTRE